MNIINLKAYRAKEIDFANKVKNNTKIEFENKFSYNVNYPNGQNICIGELFYSAVSKQFPDKFFIKIVVEGIFDYDKSVKREKVHIESFKQLFPYVKALITTVTANAGIPPLLIPNVDIEKSSIYKFDLNRNGFKPPAAPDENEDDV